ncbi:hypothetical protein DFJ74DRAFT_716516, partial [Hyaloraphidium curvatum]
GQIHGGGHRSRGGNEQNCRLFDCRALPGAALGLCRRPGQNRRVRAAFCLGLHGPADASPAAQIGGPRQRPRVAAQGCAAGAEIRPGRAGGGPAGPLGLHLRAPPRGVAGTASARRCARRTGDQLRFRRQEDGRAVVRACGRRRRPRAGPVCRPLLPDADVPGAHGQLPRREHIHLPRRSGDDVGRPLADLGRPQPRQAAVPLLGLARERVQGRSAPWHRLELARGHHAGRALGRCHHPDHLVADQPAHGPHGRERKVRRRGQDHHPHPLFLARPPRDPRFASPSGGPRLCLPRFAPARAQLHAPRAPLPARAPDPRDLPGPAPPGALEPVGALLPGGVPRRAARVRDLLPRPAAGSRGAGRRRRRGPPPRRRDLWPGVVPPPPRRLGLRRGIARRDRRLHRLDLRDADQHAAARQRGEEGEGHAGDAPVELPHPDAAAGLCRRGADGRRLAGGQDVPVLRQAGRGRRAQDGVWREGVRHPVGRGGGAGPGGLHRRAVGADRRLGVAVCGRQQEVRGAADWMGHGRDGCGVQERRRRVRDRRGRPRQALDLRRHHYA